MVDCDCASAESHARQIAISSSECKRFCGRDVAVCSCPTIQVFCADSGRIIASSERLYDTTNRRKLSIKCEIASISISSTTCVATCICDKVSIFINNFNAAAVACFSKPSGKSITILLCKRLDCLISRRVTIDVSIGISHINSLIFYAAFCTVCRAVKFNCVVVCLPICCQGHTRACCQIQEISCVLTFKINRFRRIFDCRGARAC